MGESIAIVLQHAIQEIKHGNLDVGEKGLAKVITSEPNSIYAEKAWIWISVTFDDPEHKKVCFRNALKINPDNMEALRGLSNLPNRVTPYNQLPKKEQSLPWIIQDQAGFLPMLMDTNPLGNYAEQ